MTAGTALLLLLLIGLVVALFAHAYSISPWWLFGAACGLAALIVALALAVVNTPCSQSDEWNWAGVPFVLAAGVSLTLYAAAALAAIVSGFRLGGSQGVGKAVSRFVVCPLLSVLGVGVVFYAALATVFHCFELG